MNTIDPDQYGISFSFKQCRSFGLDADETLAWLLTQGFRRVRLMSYWNEHEKQRGEYNFESLDHQITAVAAEGGVITLCLGVKQPRWPEYHWPSWALELSPQERAQALLDYVAVVVRQYKDNPAIISWQLENEALLEGFGSNVAIDRKRLRAEYELVKSLDASRPITMSTSNGWGIPLRRPRPDIVGFSYYTIMHNKGDYRETIQKPWLHRLRKQVVRLFLRRPVFIHELQLEPWGYAAIWKMTPQEQDRSMDVRRIRRNLVLARSLQAAPIDLWGAEWWFWRLQQGDDTIWQVVRDGLQTS